MESGGVAQDAGERLQPGPKKGIRMASSTQGMDRQHT